MTYIRAKLVHVGQYSSYGDAFDVYDVETDATKEETVEWFLTKVYTKALPSKSEWSGNVRNEYNKDKDYWGFFFSGYYEITPVEGGFRFTRCTPYCD
ncbi:MAG: hypothetical protein IKV50_09160 [Clostridia bacterium]|nr:hypothetical protein [Clostridia bacterium]MBR5264845.1 hypothetical protein [Clostridia bacterium]